MAKVFEVMSALQYGELSKQLITLKEEIEKVTNEEAKLSEQDGDRRSSTAQPMRALWQATKYEQFLAELCAATNSSHQFVEKIKCFTELCSDITTINKLKVDIEHGSFDQLGNVIRDLVGFLKDALECTSALKDSCHRINHKCLEEAKELSLKNTEVMNKKQNLQVVSTATGAANGVVIITTFVWYYSFSTCLAVGLIAMAVLGLVTTSSVVMTGKYTDTAAKLCKLRKTYNNIAEMAFQVKVFASNLERRLDPILKFLQDIQWSIREKVLDSASIPLDDMHDICKCMHMSVYCKKFKDILSDMQQQKKLH